MRPGSLQRIRFEGTRGTWTVEGEAGNADTIVFHSRRDTFAVRRIVDLMAGGLLTGAEERSRRTAIAPSGGLAQEFLICIEGLRPEPQPNRRPDRGQAGGQAI